MDDSGLEPPTKKWAWNSEGEILQLFETAANPASKLSSSPTIEEKVELELVKYTHHDEPSDGPLEWWSRNKSKYPNPWVVAKKYLCALATSVPSERAFSYGGQIVNQEGACLLPKMWNCYCFFTMVSFRCICLVSYCPWHLYIVCNYRDVSVYWYCDSIFVILATVIVVQV